MFDRGVRAALTGAASLLAVSCGTGATPEASETASATSSPSTAVVTTTPSPGKIAPCGSDKGAQLPPSDGSVEAVLAKASVTDDMVCGLGQVMDAAGYGFDNRTTTYAERLNFAFIELDNCKEVASGYKTWAEIVNEEVEQGAPRSESSRLNGYLERDFCPAAELRSEGVPAASDLSSGTVDENGMRGIYSKIGWYDGRFEPLPAIECTSRLGEFTGEGRAYRFDADTILCVEVPGSNRSGSDGYTWSARLAFTTPLGEDAALNRALQLVPDDAVEESRMLATNGEGPNTCRSVDYRSRQIGELAGTAKPIESDDLEYFNVTLYSDRQSYFGSSSPYTGTANAAYLYTFRSNDTIDPAC